MNGFVRWLKQKRVAQPGNFSNKLGWEQSRRGLERRAVWVALICGGLVGPIITGRAELDASWVWTISTRCPIATIQITSNAGNGQKQLDLNSYAAFSGIVVQASDGRLSSPQDGTFRGQVNGTAVTFSKSTSGWGGNVSWSVGASYSGIFSGGSFSGSAEITYQEDGFDGHRVYWHGVGTTTGPFTALVSPAPPNIPNPPLSQTAESGSTVEFQSQVSGTLPVTCAWFFNSTPLTSARTGCVLRLTNVQFSQAGAYTVVAANAFGTATSSPAMLQVIAPVARTLVPGLQLWGETSRRLNIEYAASLSASAKWQPLDSVNLTNSPTIWINSDMTPLASRFYRAWQSAPTDFAPSLRMWMFPAISLTGNIGDLFRLDWINQVGPIDAWITLGTVTLTNTTQLYIDPLPPGSPPRLYRVQALP